MFYQGDDAPTTPLTLCGIADVHIYCFPRRSCKSLDMEKKFVIYQGERMTHDWPKKIQRAQRHPSVLIRGKKIERIRYGSEKDN
jgi:hypothetical protein